MNVFRHLGGSLLVVSLVMGCASNGDSPLPPDNPFRTDREQRQLQRELRLAASELYKAARQSLESGDYTTAISRYDQLVARFPFSAFSTQAELERLYARYRNFEVDEALAAADRFLRDHPRHPAGDYVQYLKGLMNESRGQGFIASLGVDTSKDDVTFARRAFDDFAVLVQRYPDSLYVADARQRMIHLRNRIAEHELHVVRFYVKRGAYLAAARRGEHIAATYPGAPAAAEALALMERSYRTLGLDAQADATAALLRGNGLPTAADLGEAQIEPGFFSRVGSRVGGWFGLGDRATEDDGSGA